MTDSFETVIKHLSDHDNPLKIPVLFELSTPTREKLSRIEGVWPEIEADRRRKIVQLLTEIAEENFEVNFDPIFIFLLNDSDADVQMWAIRGLWENQTPQLIQPLIYLLTSGQAINVRAAAATALGQFIYLGEMEELASELQEIVEQALLNTVRSKIEDIEVVRRAIESLAFSSREGLSSIIEHAYYHDDERMRVSAIFAMGRTYDGKSWGKIVLKELESDSVPVRFEAARACGELSLHSAVDHLLRIIEEDFDSEVQQNAVWSLGQIGGTRAQKTLESLVTSADEAIRMAAEEALDELTLFSGDEDMLFDFLSDVDERDDLDLDDESDGDYLHYNLN